MKQAVLVTLLASAVPGTVAVLAFTCGTRMIMSEEKDGAYYAIAAGVVLAVIAIWLFCYIVYLDKKGVC